ncbi:MAG: PASTA domain-containing protein [Clostridiales bacterium]|jgi:stage V sporulation protein D (sporulation-specific penicillin-binding protein)|nr:PASTA domain-containing protein [Clostridiales bacterium]
MGAYNTAYKSNGKKSKKLDMSHKTGLMYFKFISMLLICVGMLAFLCYRVIWWKNEMGPEFEIQAINNLINFSSGNESSVVPLRGSILDRNRQTLAYSSLVCKVFVDVIKMDDRYQKDNIEIAEKKRKTNRVETAIADASLILGYPEADIWALMEKGPDGKLLPENNTYYKVIMTGVAPETALALKEKNPHDIYIEEDAVRSYRYDVFASQTLGFIRGDSSWGLEAHYNRELAGVPGRSFRTYDSSDRSVVSERVEPEEGLTAITTFDLGIQQIAEENAVKYGLEHGAEYTSVIVMEPDTAGIVAMASYPSFSLNAPMDPAYITNPAIAAEWSLLEPNSRELADQFDTIWKNFNITNTFEPGSIFKPITVAAALEEGIISPNDRFFCAGSLTYAGYEIHCSNRNGHGDISLRQAVAYSCNCALMQIAEKMGRDLFYKYQHDFGYGQRTGIDLPAEESAAALLHPLSGLNASELATASFGQTFKCTPIQAITGFCALINGGNLYKPYVVSQTVNRKNAVVYDRKPELVRKILSRETSDYMRDVMLDTLEYGTGARAKVAGYAIGGKSGTAEQGRDSDPDYHEAASFIGYFPADKPQYVVLTIIYRPAGVTPSASYMFMETVMDIISYKRIPPSSATATSGKTMEDYRNWPVWQAMERLNALGIDFGLVGSEGTVVSGQFPNPGEQIAQNATVYLMIDPYAEGEALAEVPDLSGLTALEAETAITAAGFTPVISYESNDNTYKEYNWVYAQMPEPFIMISPGSQIRIKVRADSGAGAT